LGAVFLLRAVEAGFLETVRGRGFFVLRGFVIVLAAGLFLVVGFFLGTPRLMGEFFLELFVFLRGVFRTLFALPSDFNLTFFPALRLAIPVVLSLGSKELTYGDP
jgi:hypothetical protein